MIRTAKATAIAFAAVLGAASVPGAAKVLKQLPAKLDPAKAYVLVEIGQVEGTKAQGQLTFARYAAEPGDVRGLGRAAAAPGANPGRKENPHETTVKQLVKDGPRRLYLLELEPDLWVVEGANGTAFSLGSATVRLAPGSITDLGVATVIRDYAEGEEPYKLTGGKLAKIALLGMFAGSAMPQPVPMAVSFRPRTASDIALPAMLAPQAVGVAWGDPVKFGNHLGGLVNRMGGRAARPDAAVAPTPTAP